MVPLLALVLVTLSARLVLHFAKPGPALWRRALRFGLAALFMVTASAHFSWLRDDLIRMVPPVFGDGAPWVTLTGVAEIAGAIGLLVPATRRAAAACLVLLLVAVFPANVHAALQQIPFDGGPATPLLPRLVEQLFYLACVAWAGLARGEVAPSQGCDDRSEPTHMPR